MNINFVVLFLRSWRFKIKISIKFFFFVSIFLLNNLILIYQIFLLLIILIFLEFHIEILNFDHSYFLNNRILIWRSFFLKIKIVIVYTALIQWWRIIFKPWILLVNCRYFQFILKIILWNFARFIITLGFIFAMPLIQYMLINLLLWNVSILI